MPFDPVNDYNSYVDGRPRADGVRTFLASRGIALAEGSPDDPAEAETVYGLGERKNAVLLRRIRADGVFAYPGSVAYLRDAQRAGLRRAVVSASANCHAVLVAAGLDDLVEVKVDGIVAAHEGLRGKPAPDTFLAAAERWGSHPRRPPSSRTPWPGSRPAGPEGSGTSWGSTGSATPTSCARAERPSW